MASPKPKYTPEQVVAALNECEGMLFLAARRLGCHVATLHKYINRYPACREAREQKRGEFVDTAELKLLDAVRGGEAWAVCFTLKTQAKNRGYVERQEHTGADGGPLQSEVKVATLERFAELYREVDAERAALVAGADGRPQPLLQGEAADAAAAAVPQPDVR
jgi:hypothetical protein